MAIKRVQKRQAISAVRDYVRHLSAQGLFVQKAYLFGSHASGDAHGDSDVDVAIVSPDFKDDFTALQLLWDHLRKEDIARRLEPVGFTPRAFNPRTNPLASAIWQEGVEVKL